MELKKPTLNEMIKFGSLAVHVEELLENGIAAHTDSGRFDIAAITQLLQDEEIQARLEELRPLGLLPVKRSQ